MKVTSRRTIIIEMSNEEQVDLISALAHVLRDDVRTDTPEYEVLARFRSELAGAPR